MSRRFTAIDELLKAGGIGRTTIAKLKAAGISFLEDLVLFNPEELSERANIDYERASKVIRNARRILGQSIRVYRGDEYASLLASREFFTTGVKSLDELLGGGITVFDIYELAGEFGAGKTQLSHQISVTVQLPVDRGGLGGKTVYIDTEGTFSPGRIESVADRFGVNDPLKNIYVARPLSVDELEEFVVLKFPDILKDNIKLIIIDSIIALYRAQFRGREWLARRQQRINYLLDWLKRYARIYRLAVIITNQVISSPTPWGVSIKLPAGGNIIAHASTHRFLLRRAGDKIIMECIDSPRIPKGAIAEFKIREEGIVDV